MTVLIVFPIANIERVLFISYFYFYFLRDTVLHIKNNFDIDGIAGHQSLKLSFHKDKRRKKWQKYEICSR